MTTDIETRQWMQERFDRIDDQVDRAIKELAQEIKTTRHGQRESMEQLTIQVVQMFETISQHSRDIVELQRRTGEGGPIDERFRRHDTRIVAVTQAQMTTGRFTWADVLRFLAGLAAATSVAGAVVAVIAYFVTTAHS